MSQYILRLDDASDYMDVEKWQRIEDLLDQYGIKPLVGVIPENKDPSLTETYEQDPEFWNKTARWKAKRLGTGTSWLLSQIYDRGRRHQPGK